MQSSSYIPILMIFIILFIRLYNQKIVIARKIIKRKTVEEKIEVVELAKRFIGKECVIYAFDSNHQFEGIIKEVSDSAILVEKDGKLEVINLEFVIRIREYPRNKKGKKKSVIFD